MTPHPEVVREAARFPNDRGISLAGRVDRPAGAAPRAWAVVAPCFTCTKDLTGLYHLAGELARRGVAALRVDFTGLGESGGAFEETDLDTQAADLRAAVGFLRHRRGEAPVFLVGHSLGGAAALLAARSAPEAAGVATVAAPAEAVHVAGSFPQMAEAEASGRPAPVTVLGRRFRLSPGFLGSLRRADLGRVLDDLGRPLLVLHAPGDRIAPVAEGEQLFARARQPKAFVPLAGADHLLSRPEDARRAGRWVARWIGEWLPGGDG